MRSFPKVLRIEPASQCNLACIHCPTGTVDMKRTIMKEDIFEKVCDGIRLHIDDIKVVVLYHGGEPLLNKNFIQMIDQIKAINSSILIKTVSNGMLLTPKISDELVQTALDEIEFSLDGLSASENELIRRKSDTGVVLNNIKYLLEKIKENASKLNVSIATTQFIDPQNNIPESPKWLQDFFQPYNINYKCANAMVWPHMGDTDMFAIYEEKNLQHGKESYCDHIENTITVRADGKVVACCYDLTDQLVMGDIHEEKLDAIWHGSKYQALRQSIYEANYNPMCKECAVVGNQKYLIPLWRQ